MSERDILIDRDGDTVAIINILDGKETDRTRITPGMAILIGDRLRVVGTVMMRKTPR